MLARTCTLLWCRDFQCEQGGAPRRLTELRCGLRTRRALQSHHARLCMPRCPVFVKSLLIPASSGPGRSAGLCQVVPVGLGTVHEMASKKSLTTGRHVSRGHFDGWEGSMSFLVVRHEHPTIFVVNRQTYETYRFTIGDGVALAHPGPPSDLAEARRTAIAFLAQRERENALP
jgi:hypothetical protein